ncbi:hypothetical protein M758_4G006600 [Ceratodon purpureus]|nr:hypothetical protein M758_4G006600 [Ceratodon purpureus]
MFIQYTREVVPMDSRTNTHDAALTDTKRDTDTETESGVGLALRRPLRLHLRPPPIVHRYAGQVMSFMFTKYLLLNKGGVRKLELR